MSTAYDFGYGFALAFDEFKEDDHPRKDNGQFGSGGGGAKKEKAPAPKKSGSRYFMAPQQQISRAS